MEFKKNLMGKTTQNNQKRFLIRVFPPKIETAQVAQSPGKKISYHPW